MTLLLSLLCEFFMSLKSDRTMLTTENVRGAGSGRYMTSFCAGWSLAMIFSNLFVQCIVGVLIDDVGIFSSKSFNNRNTLRDYDDHSNE